MPWSQQNLDKSKFKYGFFWKNRGQNLNKIGSKEVEIDNLESEVRYNSILNCKEKCFVMDQNYEIKFKISNFETQIFLQKGDRISTWKHFLLSSENVLKEIQESGLRMLSMSVDKTNSFGLVVCSLDY